MLGHLDAYGNAARGNRAVCMMPRKKQGCPVECAEQADIGSGHAQPLSEHHRLLPELDVESVGNVTRLSKL